MIRFLKFISAVCDLEGSKGDIESTSDSSTIAATLQQLVVEQPLCEKARRHCSYRDTKKYYAIRSYQLVAVQYSMRPPLKRPIDIIDNGGYLNG